MSLRIHASSFTNVRNCSGKAIFCKTNLLLLTIRTYPSKEAYCRFGWWITRAIPSSTRTSMIECDWLMDNWWHAHNFDMRSPREESHTLSLKEDTHRGIFLCILAHYGENSLMGEFPNDEVTRNGDILYNSLDGGPQLRGQEERESSLEREWEKREFGLLFCRRSNGQKTNRMSTRSNRGTRDGNFVRNSLQMQSRDFEQLCEFMMRVNPFYDSSEGWRESSDEEEERPVCLFELVISSMTSIYSDVTRAVG